jgi:hypothetical protein
VEYWRAGLHITKNGGVIGGTAEVTNFLTSIRNAFTTYHTITAVAAGSKCWLTDLSGAYIGTDGKYALGSLQSTTRVPMTTPTAGIGVNGGPYSQSIVLSLRSLLLRGPGSHGRVYWPATSAQIVPDTGVMSTANVNSIAAGAQSLINAINVQAALTYGSGCNVGLVSPLGSGFQSPVTRVGIGQRLDSMESRERDIPESHVFSNLTLAAALQENVDDEFRRRMHEEFPDADLP